MSTEQVATCIATEGARRFFKDPTTLAGLVSQLHKEGSTPLTLTPVMTGSMFDQSPSVQTERLPRTEQTEQSQLWSR